MSLDISANPRVVDFQLLRKFTGNTLEGVIGVPFDNGVARANMHRGTGFRHGPPDTRMYGTALASRRLLARLAGDTSLSLPRVQNTDHGVDHRRRRRCAIPSAPTDHCVRILLFNAVVAALLVVRYSWLSPLLQLLCGKIPADRDDRRPTTGNLDLAVQSPL